MSAPEVEQIPSAATTSPRLDAIEVTEIDAAIPNELTTPSKTLTIRTRNLTRTTTNDMSTPTPSHSAGNGCQTPASTPAGSISISEGTGKGSPYTPYSPYKREVFVKETNKVVTVTERGKLVMLNDYRMLKTIGKGAFGEVKLAALQKPGADYERYAVKIIRRQFLMGGRKSLGNRLDRSPGMDSSPSPANNSPASRFFGTGNSTGSDKDDSIAARVKQEIAIMKQLTHPNLVQLIEILDDPDSRCLYLVMEYVEAGPIMTFDINTNTFKCTLTGGVMLESMASRVFKDLISALGYLHLNHIAHRDIKPDNLLVDYKGNLKVSDFGVSNHFVQERQKAAVSLKTLARSQSRGAVSKTEGTFPFYSPEMCKENSTSYSAYMADIWAATICLWIFVFGKMPFYHRDVLRLFAMIRTEDPIMPHAVSPELAHLFQCLLQKDVTKRMSIVEIQRHPWLKRSITPRNTPIIVRGNTLESFDGLLTVRTEYDEVDPEAVEAYSKLSPMILESLRQRAREARARVEDRRECMVRHSITGIRSLLTKSNKKSRSNSDVDDIDIDVELDNFSDISRQSSNTSDDSDPLARMVSFDDFNMSNKGSSHHHHHNHNQQQSKKRSNPIAVAAAAMGRLRTSASFGDDDEEESSSTIFKKIGFGRSKSKKNTEERPTSAKSSPPPRTVPLAASPAPISSASSPNTPAAKGLRPGRRRTAPPTLSPPPVAQRSPTIVEEDERSPTPVEENEAATPPPHGCCVIS